MVSEHGIKGERIVNFITAADLTNVHKILEEYWGDFFRAQKFMQERRFRFTKPRKIDKINLGIDKGAKKGQSVPEIFPKESRARWKAAERTGGGITLSVGGRNAEK